MLAAIREDQYHPGAVDPEAVAASADQSRATQTGLRKNQGTKWTQSPGSRGSPVPARQATRSRCEETDGLHQRVPRGRKEGDKKVKRSTKN